LEPITFTIDPRYIKPIRDAIRNVHFEIVNNVESYFTAVTVTIPEGNYSITSLITSLK
jgi:hypothetical protein